MATAKGFPVDPSVREVTADSLNVTYGAQLAVKGVTTFLPTSVKADGATFDLDEPARLVLGSTTDEEFNAVTLKGAGTFEKRGAGTLMLRSAKIATPISVKAGTLAFASGYAQTNTWFKFSILKNRWNVMGDKPDNTETQFSKIRFYDAANNAYSAGWNGSLYDSGWNLFADDNMADGCYSTSRPYEVIAKPTGSGIVAYRFADYTSGGSAVKTPAVWQVYAGNSEQGPWTLIDERQCMTTDGVRGWEAYNGGAYFYFTNRCSLTESAFTGTPKLELAHGTTLDVRETAAELADVTLDLSGDGAAAALRGGKLADTGVLNIVSEMRPDGATSLLSLDAVTLPADFSGWTVKWNGVAMRRCSLRTEGGVLKLLLQGLAIIVR